MSQRWRGRREGKGERQTKKARVCELEEGCN